jgi:hypothetical protein
VLCALVCCNGECSPFASASARIATLDADALDVRDDDDDDDDDEALRLFKPSTARERAAYSVCGVRC